MTLRHYLLLLLLLLWLWLWLWLLLLLLNRAIIARALNKSGYSFWLVFSNPAKALSPITESLGKAN
jgi:hypothetical protein